jgi:CRISPR system Cascade subunit CasB
MEISDQIKHVDASLNDSSSSLKSLIGRLAELIVHLLPGDIAELRRSENAEMPSLAFWKILVTLPDYDKNQRTKEWQSILAALAYMKGLHNSKVPLGSALKQADYSESRLTKLLNATSKSLRNEIATVARFLSAKGQDADLSQLANLILAMNDAAIQARRRIAKDFYNNN